MASLLSRTGTRLLLAFRIPQYRWLWVSSLSAAIGNNAFMLAQGWLILELTDSAFMVGLGPGLSGITNLLFSPLGGVLADRYDRRVILVLWQSAQAAALLALGAVAVIGDIQVWHILLVSALLGVARALQGPARSSLMYDVVGRAALVNAMAGQFLAFNVAAILGAPAAGFAIAAFDPAVVLLATGLFFVASAVAMVPLPGGRPGTAQAHQAFFQSFTEGLRFALADRPIRAVLAAILVTEALGFSTRSMFPIVVRDVLSAGPEVLGLLNMFSSIGGVAVTLVLSGLGDIPAKGRVFLVAASGFGAFLLLFAFSRSIPLSLGLLLLNGGFGVAYDTLGSTLLQTLAPDHMRGRVMGLYSTLLSGFSIGALAMGAVANVWGVSIAIALGGGAVCLNALRLLPLAGQISARSAAAGPLAQPGSH